MWVVELDNDSWVTGFFEGQASFAVNIGLQKTKNKRYVVFKPVINIVSVDKHQVEFIKKYFDLEMKVGKKKRKENYHNEYFSLMIQRFEDVEKILDKLSEYKFKSPIKEKKLMRFV